MGFRQSFYRRGPQNRSVAVVEESQIAVDAHEPLDETRGALMPAQSFVMHRSQDIRR